MPYGSAGTVAPGRTEFELNAATAARATTGPGGLNKRQCGPVTSNCTEYLVIVAASVASIPRRYEGLEKNASMRGALALCDPAVLLLIADAAALLPAFIGAALCLLEPKAFTPERDLSLCEE